MSHDIVTSNNRYFHKLTGFSYTLYQYDLNTKQTLHNTCHCTFKWSYQCNDCLLQWFPLCFPRTLSKIFTDFCTKLTTTTKKKKVTCAYSTCIRLYMTWTFSHWFAFRVSMCSNNIISEELKKNKKT